MNAPTRGRRTGPSDTRSDILDAAVHLFADRGYGRTTIRSVAESAGVDPSLVTHYFGNKEGLLSATIESLQELPRLLARELSTPDGDLGTRIALLFFHVWEDPDLNPRARALLRASSESPAAATMLSTTLNAYAMQAASANNFQGRAADFQAVMAQLVGVSFGRYILGVRPLADLSSRELAEKIGPSLTLILS